jgi:tetratricopeptide (TPR) repeat protein
MMPDKSPTYSKSFDENIESLFDELKLAIQWDRPSILLAVHKSIPSQVKAEAALEDKLIRHGQTVVKIEVNREATNPVQTILQTENREKTICFISSIDRGGGTDGKAAYEALNIYRELFVENRIRAVFWLTVSEALALPHSAPDFWAFRHRVVEFSSPRAAKNIGLPAGILIWHIQAANDSPAKLTEKILGRERLLKELPSRPESLSTRVELLYTLGYLYWALGDITKSTQSLTSGAGLAENPELSKIKSWLQNGLAILYYEAGEYQKAFDLYTGLTAGGSKDALLWINLSAILCALGKNSEAISQGKKAVEMGPTSARLWKSLGYIYVSLGRLDDAAACFKKAIELMPTNGLLYAAMAVCYSVMGLPDDALEQINAARKLSGDQSIYPMIYEEAIRGNPDGTVSRLRTAIKAGRISRVDVRRDPNIHILLDDALGQTLL